MGWQAPFFLIVGLALAAMAAMKLIMPSTPSEQSEGLRVLGQVFSIRAVVLVPAILVGYGILSWIGTMRGGKVSDTSLRTTLFGSITAMSASGCLAARSS